MWRLTVFVVAIAVAMTAVEAFGLEGQEVAYVAGTVPALKVGIVGTLDTTVAAALEFRSGTDQFSIPYARIISYQCREETRFHLGVLPAIAVGLVKKRTKVHFVDITWQGENNEAQVVTLETSKRGSEALLTVLRARAVEASKTKSQKTSGGTRNGVQARPLPTTP